MADEQAGLWFVTDVETSETVEVVGGGRSSEDVGGGFGSGAVQAVRKSLTQRVQISADELKRQISNLLASSATYSISHAPRPDHVGRGRAVDRDQLRGADQHPRQRREGRRQGRHKAQLQA